MNPIPPPARIRELSSMCTSLPIPQVDIRCGLAPSFDLLSSKDIRHFLFNSSPQHISHLVCPTSIQPSFLCATTSTGVDLDARPSTPFRLSGDSHHQASYSLFVPTLQEGTVTLGYGVYRAILNGTALRVANPQQEQTESLNFRFAYDCRTRNFLLVFDQASHDAFFFYNVCAKNSRSESIFNGVFAKKRLLDLAINDDYFSMDDLVSCILMLEVRQPTYPCCVCGVVEQCSCELEVLRPSINFTHFIRGMSYHTRSTTVNAVRLNFLAGANGKKFQRTVLGTRYTLQGILDANVQEDLKSWSICDFIKGLHHDPTESKSLLPCPSSEQQSTCVTTRCSSGESRLLDIENREDVGDECLRNGVTNISESAAVSSQEAEISAFCPFMQSKQTDSRSSIPKHSRAYSQNQFNGRDRRSLTKATGRIRKPSSRIHNTAETDPGFLWRSAVSGRVEEVQQDLGEDYESPGPSCEVRETCQNDVDTGGDQVDVVDSLRLQIETSRNLALRLQERRRVLRVQNVLMRDLLEIRM